MQSNPALVRRSVWDLTLQRARGGCAHMCRASWQADITGLQAVKQNSISPDIPEHVDLNIDHWQKSHWPIANSQLSKHAISMWV